MAARIAESMTRDFSVFAAPGTSMYLVGSTSFSLCLEISLFPSIELCMAHAIMTSVPGYIKIYVKNFMLFSNF